MMIIKYLIIVSIELPNVWASAIHTVLAPATAVKMAVNSQTEILVPVNSQNEF